MTLTQPLLYELLRRLLVRGMCTNASVYRRLSNGRLVRFIDWLRCGKGRA